MLNLQLTSCSDEHQRRSPDCLYFSLSASSQTTKGRKPKKSRSSKATRLSTQSRLSVAPEEPSVVENEPDDNGVVSVADAVKPAKGNKGRPKGKKAKAQALTPKQDEMQIASSFVEPEDDDFEVKVAQPATSTARGKKRNSEEMAEETETAGKGAPKRRRTTARTSIASIQADHEEPVETGLAKPVEDVDVTNPDNKPQPSRPMSKKGRKGGKKTGSSMMRKGSSKSTASEASLRAGMPGDEDIDAALEEDLERPLTDDGEDERSDAFKPSKGRRFTRSKLVLKDTSASTAPARRNTRHSTFTSHDSIIELNPATSASHESQMQQAEQVQEPMFHSSPKAKTSKKIGTRKASAKQKVKAQEVKQVEGVSAATAREVEAVKPKQTRGRKASRQALSRGSWTSNMSNSQADVDVVSTIDSSALDIHILEYDSGHETDTTTKSRPTRGRKASTAKKTTENRRAGPKSRNIEDIVQPATSDQLIVEAQDSVTAPAADAKEPEPPAKSLKTHAKKQNKAAKSEQKLKGKKIISKPTEAEGAAVAVGRSEVEGLAETPLLPAAASVHSTPRPALSPQSSDAENQPPSSRPSQSRPPLSFESPVRSQETRVPLAVIATPSASSSKSNLSRLQSTFPWTVMDIDQIFHDLPDTEKEKRHSTNGANMLTSPERRLTVEEWIKYNAQRGEEKLRNDCERLVGRFEDQGVRALKTLEGIVCVD